MKNKKPRHAEAGAVAKPARWVSVTLLLLCALPGLQATHAGEEPPAASFLALATLKACDDKNQEWVVENSHEFRTIAVKVRWSAQGGKALTAQLFPSPGKAAYIGCGLTPEILEATFADF